MTEKAMNLLHMQAEKLKDKQLDFNAWKQQTVLLLMRIFGENDAKAKQMKLLEYEFNSWSLRDASGNASYHEGVRKNAAAILETAILELQHFGMPKADDLSESASEVFIGLLKDQLTGSQVKAMRNIINSAHSSEEKRRQLHDLLGSLDKEQLYDIIADTLLKEHYSKYF